MITVKPQVSTRWIQSGILAILAAIATLVMSLLPVTAQTNYPIAGDAYVNDYAQLLTPEDAASIRQSFAQLEAQQGIEAVVVTIESIQAYATDDKTVESFATHLFNTWGIGHAEKNNGILVLVAVGDRAVRIEAGAGYGTSLDSPLKKIIDQAMVPRFKQGDYSSGIRSGAEAIIAYLSQPEATTVPATPTSPQFPPSSTVSPFGENPGWLIGAGGVGLGASLIALRTYFRYRHRRCADCGTLMVRLDEVTDDQYLDAGQIAEEHLQSVDYDVWHCPNCQQHSVNRYNSLFSSYGMCPACHCKTLKSSRHTLVSPTYSSSGTARVTKACQYCAYQDAYTVTLPRLERSSSRSSGGGGSFGGGSSSGGGASGSW